MNEADKNRLAEEVNILYVAATRAKNKLLIPAEINPLRSIELAAPVPLVQTQNSRYGKGFAGDWELYSRSAAKNADPYNASNKTTNHGKRWTDEEEDKVIELYTGGTSIKEIAKKLGRGESGVRIKLMNLDMLDDEDVFCIFLFSFNSCFE